MLRFPAAAPRLSTASALTLSCTASQHQRPRQSSPGHVLPPPSSSPPPPLLPPLPPPLPCRVNYTDAVGPLRGSAASSKLTLCYPHHSLLSLQHEGCTVCTLAFDSSTRSDCRHLFFFLFCSIAVVSNASYSFSCRFISSRLFVSSSRGSLKLCLSVSSAFRSLSFCLPGSPVVNTTDVNHTLIRKLRD